MPKYVDDADFEKLVRIINEVNDSSVPFTWEGQIVEGLTVKADSFNAVKDSIDALYDKEYETSAGNTGYFSSDNASNNVTVTNSDNKSVCNHNTSVDLSDYYYSGGNSNAYNSTDGTCSSINGSYCYNNYSARTCTGY